jgi:hypothetical protein
MRDGQRGRRQKKKSFNAVLINYRLRAIDFSVAVAKAKNVERERERDRE